MKKYTTILFDLNGVLILDNPGYTSSELEQSIYKRMGTSLDDTKEKDKILEELKWSEEQFWNFDKEAWKGAIPNFELLKLIRSLKLEGYKTGLVTNTSGLILRRNEKEFFGCNLSDLFDTVIISSEVGLLKPDVSIYELALKNIDARAEETIFIDDSKRYLDGAEKLGIKTLLFTQNEPLFSELQSLGLL